MMRRLAFFLKLLAIIAVIAGGVFWFRFQPVPVERHTIEKGDLHAVVMGTGTLEARVRTTISPEIAGRIREVLVDQGDRVRAGQALVRLDDTEWKQQVAIAEADVESKQAAITRLQADIQRAQAVLKQAETNYNRLAGLHQQGAISLEDLDKATESRAIAESEWLRAKAALAEGEKNLVVTERNLEFQKAQWEDAEIKAPFDGLIVRRSREPGDIAVPGTEILALIATDQLWVRSWVDETEMARLANGQKATVYFRSTPLDALPGQLIRLGNETDRETREFVVDVEVLDLPANWAVGQRAEVYIETASRSDILLLPSRLLQRQNGQTGVFVDQQGVVAWQPVTLGLRGRDNVEVIEGLTAGQSVITPGREGGSLQPGMRILMP